MLQTITDTSANRRDVGYAFLLALVLVGFSFVLQANIGLSLADEGYLWYGAIRTAEGDVPVRDFRSYDPGRYYWVAAWFLIFGRGIMALRLAVALFQVIGLTLGLLAVRHMVNNWWLLGLIGLLLLVWMFPRHKLFDSSLALAAVYFAVRLIEKPGTKALVISGIFVGLAAFVGRNHGLYSFLAFIFLIFLLHLKLAEGRLFSQLRTWLGGVALGYAPMLLMFAFIPDLLMTTISERIVLFINRSGATNLGLPVPWPWRVDYAQSGLIPSLSAFFVGSFFLMLPIFYLGVIAYAIRIEKDDFQQRSLLFGSAFVGLFYLHHLFSRADLPHLGQDIHPFLLGFIALLYTPELRRHKYLRSGLAVFLVLGTIFAALIQATPYLDKLRSQEQFVSYNLNGDQLWLPKTQADYLDRVRALISRNVNSNEWLLIIPHSPTLYPVLQRKSPIRDTYLLFPEGELRQQEIIDDLNVKKVNWVLVADTPLDRRDDLRFRNTHPLVWQYLVSEFEPIDAPELPRNQQLLRRK